MLHLVFVVKQRTHVALTFAPRRLEAHAALQVVGNAVVLARADHASASGGARATRGGARTARSGPSSPSSAHLYAFSYLFSLVFLCS